MTTPPPSPDSVPDGTESVFDALFAADFSTGSTQVPKSSAPSAPGRQPPSAQGPSRERTVSTPAPYTAPPKVQAAVNAPVERSIPQPSSDRAEPPPREVNASRVTPSADQTESVVKRAIQIFAAVSLLAGLPLLLTHFQHLWHMPHRTHFGLLLVCVPLIIYKRLGDGVANHRQQFCPLDIGIVAVASALFAAGSLLHSPWLVVASLILIVGFLVRRLPSRNQIGFLGPWACLLLLLPFPLGIDQSIIESLQVFATQSSSRLLDLAGVNHLVTGNVLALPGKELFVDEACSGIQSLFALLSCVALFSAYTRRSTVLAIPLLLSTLVMCVLVNVLRVAIVVWAESRGYPLATGLLHQLLGGLLFVGALILVYCSEGFFLFLLAPVMNPATGSPDNRSARAWNSVTRSIHGTIFASAEAGPVSELPPRRSRTSWLSSLSVPTVVARVSVLIGTVIFAGFGLVQHVSAGDGPLRSAPDSIEELMIERSEQLDEESMPQLIGDWQRVGFSRK